MPEGNGDKGCPKCKGRGVVPMEIDGWPGLGTQNCECVFKRDLIANVKRVWQVLLSVESAETSPLLGMTRQNLWITATNYALRRHLRYVAFRMGTQWDARVVADATLVTAWLSTAKNVNDPDVLTLREDGVHDRPSDDFLTLVDLAAPFDLLIIRLGVKAAKNREMPNVLAEAINERDILGKPTWVVDSPLKPLAPGHICYSDAVVEILDGFRRVILPEENPLVVGEAAQYAPKAVSRPAGGLDVSNYGVKPGIQVMGLTTPTAPQVPKPKPVVQPDADDCSVDSLMAAATAPVIAAVEDSEGETQIPDTAFDTEEALDNYPSAEDLRSNGTPAWLKKATLTREERLKSKGKGGRK